MLGSHCDERCRHESVSERQCLNRPYDERCSQTHSLQRHGETEKHTRRALARRNLQQRRTRSRRGENQTGRQASTTRLRHDYQHVERPGQRHIITSASSGHCHRLVSNSGRRLGKCSALCCVEAIGLPLESPIWSGCVVFFVFVFVCFVDPS